MENRLSSIKPEILDEHLPPPAPYFVLEWGFRFQFAHGAFVRVEAFDFTTEHTLRTPIYLGAELHPDVVFKPDPTHETAAVQDRDGKLLCHVEITRTGEHWAAKFRHGAKVMGRAQGTLGARTSSQLVEAAMTALVRQAAVKNA